jgi:hypothetical protein
VDMSLLGCNSKILWQEIFQQIVDIVAAKTEKVGIILCKYFHEIHTELLEIFYSYMQKSKSMSITLKFMLHTESVSFLPDNILHSCEIISLSRPTKAAYLKVIQKKEFPDSLSSLDKITNTKLLFQETPELMLPHKIICEKIIQNILDVESIHFLRFRDTIYDLFIYHLNVTDCVWYIVHALIAEKQLIPSKDMSALLLRTFVFLQYYNNNYRPIYHVENYFLSLAQMIHGLS